MSKSKLPKQPAKPYVKPTWKNTEKGIKYCPTHPDLFKVEFSQNESKAVESPEENAEEYEEQYSSRLVALKSFPPNTVITYLTNLSLAEEKAYSSVQFGSGPRDHFELNSDLLFMNHSCDPSVYVDVSSAEPTEWCIRTTARGVKASEDLTFFYPSTEWDMAQTFTCHCGASSCLGQVQGAKYIETRELENRGFINQHIKNMKKEAQELTCKS